MITISNHPGLLPTERMRQLFEQAVTQTPRLSKCTPLGIMQVNGEFSHYMNADTDTMWIGFAIGMRCAERLAKANLNNLWLSPGVPGLSTLASSPDAAKPVAPGETKS